HPLPGPLLDGRARQLAPLHPGTRLRDLRGQLPDGELPELGDLRAVPRGDRPGAPLGIIEVEVVAARPLVTVEPDQQSPVVDAVRARIEHDAVRSEEHTSEL